MIRSPSFLALLGGLLLAVAATASHAAWIESPLITQGQAEVHGLKRAWHTQLSIDSERAKIKSLKLEAGLILAVTSDGWLHVIDAETGVLNWRTLVGEPKYVTLSAGANEAYVAAVNGDALYIYDRATGRVSFKHKLRGTAELGPALTISRVLVPTVKGPLESYPLDGDPLVDILGPQQLPAAGRMVNEPATFHRSVVWGGDRDRLFGQQFSEQPSKFNTYIRFGVNSGPISFPPLVFVGTKAGFLVAYSQDRGHQLWEFPAGSPIFHPPVALNDVVYALPQDGGMFAVKSDTGQQLWYADEPLKFVSASPKLIYTLDYRNRLAMIDVKTGARADVMPLPEGTKRIINQRTDRLYLYNPGGLIQCLHDSQLVEPHRYEPAKPAGKPGEVDPFAVPGAAPAEAAPAEAAPAAAAPAPGDAMAEPMAEAGAMP